MPPPPAPFRRSSQALSHTGKGTLGCSQNGSLVSGPFPGLFGTSSVLRRFIGGPPSRGISSAPVPPVPPPLARFRRSSQALSHTGEVLWGVVKTGARFGAVFGRFRDLVETLYWRAPPRGSSTPVPPVPPPPARFRRSWQALSHTGKVLWGVVKTGAWFGAVTAGPFPKVVASTFSHERYFGV